MKLATIIILFSLLFSSNVNAESDAKRGETVFQICTVCHGEDAKGNEDFEAPRLQGQYGWYLTSQLENFKGKVRGMHEDDDGGQIMQPMASSLTEQQIEDVVAYILSL